jgi:AdoMet-dependent rRNA methyltransferase SPB1
MPVGSPCIGVDLVPIRTVPGCVGIVGDITTEACRVDIRHALKSHPSAADDGIVDAELNDGSPNMGKA